MRLIRDDFILHILSFFGFLLVILKIPRLYGSPVGGAVKTFENLGNTRSITYCTCLRGLLLALSDLILAF